MGEQIPPEGHIPYKTGRPSVTSVLQRPNVVPTCLFILSFDFAFTEVFWDAAIKNQVYFLYASEWFIRAVLIYSLWIFRKILPDGL